jgi:hypothetical protein
MNKRNKGSELKNAIQRRKNVHATNITCGAMTSIAMVNVREAFK